MTSTEAFSKVLTFITKFSKTSAEKHHTVPGFHAPSLGVDVRDYRQKMREALFAMMA